MSDDPLNDLSCVATTTAAAKGFWDDWALASQLESMATALVTDEQRELCWQVSEALKRNVIGMKLALIHSEVSEMLEDLRRTPIDKLAGDENFADEAADVFIRLVDLTGALGIDLDASVEFKMEKNRAREHKHGKLA